MTCDTVHYLGERVYEGIIAVDGLFFTCAFQNTEAITLPTDCCVFDHTLHFSSDSKVLWWIHVSSIVIPMQKFWSNCRIQALRTFNIFGVYTAPFKLILHQKHFIRANKEIVAKLESTYRMKISKHFH